MGSSLDGGVVGDEYGDELPQRDSGRERLVGQGRATEGRGVVIEQPAEDLAPLVGLPVGGRDGIYHDLLRDWAAELLRHHCTTAPASAASAAAPAAAAASAVA